VIGEGSLSHDPVELSEVSDGAYLLADAAAAVVYLWSMHDNVWTRTDRLRSGDRIKVRLFSWDDWSAPYDKFQSSRGCLSAASRPQV
jgi:hypothetical protein